MERVIKFRAWDKLSDKMIYNKDLQAWTIATFEWNNYHFMQWTGLFDKNGKDIYEGDVILNDTRRQKCIVKWSDKLAEFIVEYEDEEEYPLWESVGNLHCVIGNIYETPELLTH